MRHLIIIIFLGFCSFGIAQNNFDTAMEKAFQYWEKEGIDKAEHMFERIANAEPNRWLPHYYIAQINSIKSWPEKDENIISAQLKKAQKHIDKAAAIKPNHPEILVMQAQILTNWIAFDGMTYGMKYSSKVSQLYEKAAAIAPNNPRVAFCKAEWQMGTAKYFGQDPSQFCEDIATAVKHFESYEPTTPLDPNWGEKRAIKALEDCES